MRRRPPRASRVLVAMAVLLAASATLALRGHLARLEARTRAAGPGVAVVVAATDLTRGTAIAPSMLREARMPKRYLPPGALESRDEVEGRILAADVAAGEPLTVARLAPPGGPVASLVPPGLRAVSVTVALPRGAIVPGDRVDVLATFATGAPHAEVVATEAEVLLVTEASGFDQTADAATVLLLVSPETAERLAYARALADLSLAIAPPTSAGFP